MTSFAAVMPLPRDIANEHFAFDLAHVMLGVYIWEAAQFVLFDLAMTCAMLRTLCPAHFLWPFFSKLTMRLKSIRIIANIDTTNHAFEMNSMRGLEDSMVQPSHDVQLDIDLRHSPFESWPSCTNYLDRLAQVAYILLRVFTILALVSLLIIIDWPATTSQLTPVTMVDQVDSISCDDWKVVNVLAWVTPTASFALIDLLVLLRIATLWNTPVRCSGSNPNPNPNPNPIATEQCPTSIYQRIYLPTSALAFMQMIEWVLLVVGAVRVATLNAVLSVVSSRLECVYSPSSELVGSVIEFETSRISAAMFFGMNLSVFRGSSIDRGLGLGVCVYYTAFDLLVAVLVISGICKNPEFDKLSSSISLILSDREAATTSPATASTISLSSTSQDSVISTSSHRADHMYSSVETAPPLVEQHNIDIDHGVQETAAEVHLTIRAEDDNCGQEQSPENTRFVLDRLLKAWVPQGLFCILTIVFIRTALLVRVNLALSFDGHFVVTICVAYNTSKEQSATMNFETLCLCVPGLVISSVAANRLFHQITQSSSTGDGFLLRHPPLLIAGSSALDPSGIDPNTYLKEVGLPSYISRNDYLRRLKAERALSEHMVVRTIGGTVRDGNIGKGKQFKHMRQERTPSAPANQSNRELAQAARTKKAGKQKAIDSMGMTGKRQQGRRHHQAYLDLADKRVSDYSCVSSEGAGPSTHIHEHV